MRGEDLFLAADYARAASAFSAAAAIDTGYALAYYRLSAARLWNFDFIGARNAADRASFYAERLPPQHKPLLTAWSDFLDGRADAAQLQYNKIVTNDAHDLEAISGLAEVLVHFNPVRGRPAAESRQHLDRVLAISSVYGEARFHAMEFAARERNRVVFDSLFATIDARNTQFNVWRAVRAFTWGGRAEQEDVLRALRSSDMAAGLAAGRLAAHTHNFAAAERVARQLASTASTPAWRAGAMLMTAQTRLAAGDWRGAEQQLQAAAALEIDWTRELTAIYLLHPAAGATRERLLEEVKLLTAWRAVGGHTPESSFFFGAHALVHPVLRLYLIGMLNNAAGERNAAAVAQDSLVRYSGSEEAMHLANALGASLRAHMLLASGDTRGAINGLRTVTLDAAPEFLALSPFYSRAWDRLVLADLYLQAGDRRRAADWYQSLTEGFDFVYAAVAHQRLADLYRLAGDSAKAGLHARELARLRP